MPLLAQVGYGTGNKLELGIKARAVIGAIMSPRDETGDHLKRRLSDLRRLSGSSIRMFDPQFYVSTIGGARAGHLTEYPYFSNATLLSRMDFAPRQVRTYVKDCLNYQRGLEVSHLVSPTVMVEDLTDMWSQIALNLAEESLDHWSALKSPHPLLLSIVVSENALRNDDEVRRYADALSALDAPGFYVVVRRPQGCPPAIDAEPMSNLMYVVYVLSEINEYWVACGYSDWLGLLLQAAGADCFATGWFQNLRQFSVERFMPAKGGRRPRKRYSSAPLLSSILIQPELQGASMVGLIDDVLSGTKHDAILRDDPAGREALWTDEVSCLHHWETLTKLSRVLDAKKNVPAKLDQMLMLIRQAESRFRILSQQGVEFDPTTTGNHLAAWAGAISSFRASIGI